jgi:hypothetical protein
VETESVDDAMTARADVLAKLIRKMLANHKAKELDANKQSHFTLGWFAVLANYVRDEPDAIDENKVISTIHSSTARLQ